MSTLRGLITGGLALTALEVLVANQGAPERAGTLITLATGAVKRLVDPSVPLIPNRTLKTTGGQAVPSEQIILAN